MASRKKTTRLSRSADKAGTGTNGRRLGINLVAPSLLILAGAAAYLSSFHGVFLFDDAKHILQAERIRDLTRLGDVLRGRRPVVDLTLAFNYALGGLEPWGYHLANLAIHVLAGLTLFGVVRRGGRRIAANGPGNDAPTTFAFVVALLWLLHPLETQSVSYVVQRGESLMGLFYLLTLYCAVRATESPRPVAWSVAAVVACALGMGSKAVMVTAPVAVLLFDRVFIFRSFTDALRRRWRLYAGLAGTWTILGVCGVLQGVMSPNRAAATVGLSFRGASPLDYALTQFGVLMHYLRLAIWPSPLCLDYEWPWPTTLENIIPPALAILTLIGGCIALVRRSRPLAYVAACFFLILLPTSSVIPIKDALFEHRMYLPLAAVIILVVVGGWTCLTYVCRRLAINAKTTRLTAFAAVAAVALSFGLATYRRNLVYHDRVAMWTDVSTKRPENARGHYNRGYALDEEGETQAAMASYRQALAIRPEYPEAHNNLGNALKEQGRLDEAMDQYRAALRQKPDYAEAYNNIGSVLERRGEYEEAVAYYRKALDIRPDFAEVYSNLGNALMALGRHDEAMAAHARALELEPEYGDGYVNLGIAWAKQGELDRAINAFQSALKVNPQSAEAHNNLGNALAGQKRYAESIEAYRSALKIKPEYADARMNLANALMEQGNLDSAIAEYQKALAIRSDSPQVYSNLGLALYRKGQFQRAEQACRQAIRLRPDYPEADYNLGNVLLAQGRTHDAIGAYQRAVEQRPDYAEAHSNLGIALGKLGRLDEALIEFHTALRIRPEYAEAHSNLGNALAGLRRFDDAIESYRRALKINPSFVEARFNLGRALMHAHRVAEAVTEFKAVLQLDPQHSAARNALEAAIAQRDSGVKN